MGNKPAMATEKQIERSIKGCLTIDLPEGELDDIVSDVYEHCSESYNAGRDSGYEDGYQDGKAEAFNDSNEAERVGVNYTVSAFSECKTLSDFQDKLKEITLRSYNFMQPCQNPNQHPQS